MRWTDNRLTWNPAHYDNITHVYQKQSELWLPPIVFENDISKSEQWGYDDNRAEVYFSHGNVTWHVKQSAQFTCDIDVSFYPFDTQRCPVGVMFLPMKWTDIDAHPLEGLAIYPNDFETGGTWETVEITCSFRRDWSGYGYQRPRYYFVFRRLRTFYVLNVVLPVVFLSFTA